MEPLNEEAIAAEKDRILARCPLLRAYLMDPPNPKTWSEPSKAIQKDLEAVYGIDWIENSVYPIALAVARTYMRDPSIDNDVFEGVLVMLTKNRL